MMMIRVRTNVGIWRVNLPKGFDSTTIDDVEIELKRTRPYLVIEQPLSLDPAGKEPLTANATLSEYGLTQNGTMIYCRVDPTTTASTEKPSVAMMAASEQEAAAAKAAADSNQQQHMRRIIDKDGSIKLVPTNDVPAPGQDKGFRKGMKALRDMKMHWTLTDFVALDSQYEFKIKRQEKSICEQVSLDVPSIGNFQAYLQRFAFQRKRFGFLYGKYVPIIDGDNKDGDQKMMSADADKDKKEELPPTKVVVEAIYEPPQEVDPEAAEGFVALDDDQEEVVDEIAKLLGLQKVGWIFGHEARDNYTLSSAEVIMAADFQLEAAEGIHETPFVTVTVAPKADGTVSVEAFQVSQQCMAMVAEEALLVGENPNECVVHETFTAIQEGKGSKTVENSFFLTVVPIVQHTSDMFVAEFPRINRDLDDAMPSNDEMKKHLSKSGKSGWTFVDRLADFNLLIYLSRSLDLTGDFPKICASIVNKEDLDDGYKLIIKSMAGMEGSY